MKILELKLSESIENSAKAEKYVRELEALLNALESKEIPDRVLEKINKKVHQVNDLSLNEKRSVSKIHSAHQNILEILRKEMNLTTDKFYTYLWLPLGMSAFGLPLGTVFFLIMDNPALIGTGLPVGMAVGVILGMALDKKAKEEGRVIEIDIAK